MRTSQDPNTGAPSRPISERPADGLRASDAEREQVAAVLREHAGHGRLTIDELAERVDAAYAARTRGELARLTNDLPQARSRADVDGHRIRERRELHSHVVSFVLVNLMLIGIWAFGGAGYFWPAWPLLGWGIGLVAHGAATLRARPHA